MTRAESLLNANTYSFAEIIAGDNIYNVPLFQRDYSWRDENWEDLWLDIQNAIGEGIRHYMGSIVLIKKGAKSFEVIDGQQRLTTLSILAISVIRIINELINKGIDVNDNKERKDILMRKFIGFKSPKSLLFSPKLKLNKLNDPIYSSYLIQFDKIPNINKEPKSNKDLFTAHDYFYNKLKSEIYVDGSSIELVDFIEFVGDNLQFIQITVIDELNAYLVFETLNDRGLSLTVTDLFKNYLFSKVAEEDHEHLKNKWDNILKYVKYKDFSGFLRYFWMSRNRLVTEKELFKTIKRLITNQEEVLKTISDLEVHAEVFSALSDPHDELWKGNQDLISYLSELQLFNTKQSFPLLLAAYERLDIQTFTKVVRICSIISFRYTIILESKTNILEQNYNRAAINVTKGTSKTAKEIFTDLKQLYVSDEIFENQFTLKSIKTNSKSKLVRYILYSIENYISKKSIDYEQDNGTIEHILPENPLDPWSKFFVRDTQSEFIYRLGNYTILEKKLNNAAENKVIEDKIIEYKKSVYEISKAFDYTEWNPSKLKQRQARLAKSASQIWRLDY